MDSEVKIDKKELFITSGVVSLALYSMVIALVVFDESGFNARLAWALEPIPYDLSLTQYIALVWALMCSPFPVFVYNTLLTIRYAKRPYDPLKQPIRPGSLSQFIYLIRYLLKLQSESKRMIIAKLATLGFILYFIGIICWWIYWTTSKGI